MALSPSSELRDEHDRLIRYFDATLAAQRQIADAAAAQDRAGIQDGQGKTRRAFCETARSLSDSMQPVVFVQFGGPPQDRDLFGECGQPPA